MFISERMFISDNVTYKVDFSDSLSQNAEISQEKQFMGPLDLYSVQTSISVSELPNPHPKNAELHTRNSILKIISINPSLHRKIRLDIVM